MLLLALDVLNDVVQLRNAHAERPVLLLPCEKTMFGKRFMHPFGRPAFDQLKRLGNRER